MTRTLRPAAPARTVSAGAFRCPTSALEVWLGVGAGGAAAGSKYYPMEFTNVSQRTCDLYGYPGVSADYRGHQAGSPARWVRSPFSPESSATLRPGATAHTLLRVSDVANFPAPGCRPVTATGLEVYPPGQRAAAAATFSFRACPAKEPVFMDE